MTTQRAPVLPSKVPDEDALSPDVQRMCERLHGPAALLQRGTIVDVNPPFERLSGWSREQLRGRPVGTLHVDEEYGAWFAGTVDAVVERAEPARTEWPLRCASGEALPVESSVSPLYAADDPTRVTGALMLLRDLSRARREQQRLDLLLALGHDLARTQGTREALDALCTHAVPRVADWVTVYMRRRDEGLARVSFRHRDPEMHARVAEMYARYPAGPRVAENALAHVLSTGEPWLAEEVDEPLVQSFTLDEEHARMLRDVGMGSLALVPLGDRGRVLGVLSLVTQQGPRRFAPHDLPFFEELGRKAGAWLENARLRETDRVARRRAEVTLRKLRELQAQDRFIAQNSLDLILRKGLDGTIRFASPSCAALLGHAPQEMVGRRLVDFAHEEDARASSTEDAPVGARTLTWRLRHRDGRWVWMEVLSRVVRDEKGTPVERLAIARDVTQRKAAEEVLAQREARWRSLVENAPDFIFTIDARGIVESINQPVFAASRGAAVGACVYDALPPGERERVRGIHRRVFATGKPAHYDVRLEHRGVVRHFESRAGPVVRDGRVEALTVIARDVTEARRVEAELAAARVQLAQSEKLSTLGQLVSGLAHELRTPLTYLDTNLYLLQSHLRRLVEELPPEAAARVDGQMQDRLGVALEASARINRLVDDLRRNTRIGQMDLEPARLSEVIAKGVEIFRTAYRGDVVVEADLEETPISRFDPVQMQQVLLNLLQNAVDARPRDGRVRVRTRALADGRALLEVEDAGEGIPPEVQMHMWEPFFTTKPSGTGLGLSIVRGIVEGHRGRITCASAPGEGTRFRIVLP